MNIFDRIALKTRRFFLIALLGAAPAALIVIVFSLNAVFQTYGNTVGTICSAIIILAAGGLAALRDHQKDNQ